MMKLPLSFTLLVLVAMSALAQSPAQPIITSIDPNFASTAGGTRIVITGANFDVPSGFTCVLPCPATVFFGATEVVPTQATDTRLDVVAPAHAAGAVDLTVKTGDARLVIAMGAFTFISQPEAGYETVLLPVYTEAPVRGDRGSLWQSDFWFRNDGPRDITLAPWVCPEGQACPAVFPLVHALKSGETLHNLPSPFVIPGPDPARLLYVARDPAPTCSAGLRIADTSRSTVNAGTEVPVVREADFRTSTIQLHNIPLDPHFRVTVRVFEMAQDTAKFRLNFYAEDGDASQPPVTSVELTTTSPDRGSFRMHPAWAQYTDLTKLLDLDSIVPSKLRAEVVPMTAGVRFWCLISITNNDTQMVTLVTPQ